MDQTRELKQETDALERSAAEAEEAMRALLAEVNINLIGTSHYASEAVVLRDQGGLLAELGGGLARPEAAEVGVPPQTGRHRTPGTGYSGSGRHRNPLGCRTRAPPPGAPPGATTVQVGEARCAAHEGSTR